MRRKNKGFTLVEILLVVGFIALASIGIYAVYNKVSLNQKSNTVKNQVMAISSGIEQIYGGTTGFNGVSKTVVINGRLAPDNMIDGSNLISPFGTEVRITSLALGANPSAGYLITIMNVPVEACVSLGSSMYTMFNVNVGGAYGWTGSTKVSVIQNPGGSLLEFDTNRLLVACNQSGGSDIPISFYKYK